MRMFIVVYSTAKNEGNSGSPVPIASIAVQADKNKRKTNLQFTFRFIVLFVCLYYPSWSCCNTFCLLLG